MKPDWYIKGDSLWGPDGYGNHRVVAQYNMKNDTTTYNEGTTYGIHFADGRKLEEAYEYFDPYLDLVGPVEKQIELVSGYAELRFPGHGLQWRSEHHVRTYSLWIGELSISKLIRGQPLDAWSGSGAYMDNYGVAARVELDGYQKLLDMMANLEDAVKEIAGPLGPLAAALLNKENPSWLKSL